MCNISWKMLFDFRSLILISLLCILVIIKLTSYTRMFSSHSYSRNLIPTSTKRLYQRARRTCLDICDTKMENLWNQLNRDIWSSLCKSNCHLLRKKFKQNLLLLFLLLTHWQFLVSTQDGLVNRGLWTRIML